MLTVNLKQYSPLLLIFLFIFGLFSITANAKSEDEGYIIAEKHVYPIKIQTINNTQYIKLKRVTDILNAHLTYDEDRGSYLYTLQGRQVVMTENKSLISIEGRLEYLNSPPIVKDDDLYVPVEFLLKIAPQIHRQPVIYNKASKAFVMGDEGDPFKLRVDTLSKRNYLRVIIQASQEIPLRILRNEEEIKIRFRRRIALLPFAQKQFDSDIIEKAEFQQESSSTTLVLTLREEPDDIKSYKFLNPFRLVLDFMRNPDDSELKAERSDDSPPKLTIERKNWLQSSHLRTIVLDPGHGGAEDGAIGPSGVKEKNVTLQIANKLKKIIEENMTGVRVVLTRDRDIDMDLQARTEFANNNKGDLFISIHCNGSPNRSAKGAEVFFLSTEASDEASRILAEQENRETAAYSAAPRTERSNITPILWDLAQTEYLKESSSLAEFMQKELNDLLGSRQRGMKQAPFRVLTGALMPAVLVEVAFITNAAEEKELQKAEYQSAVARAIYRSIVRFQEVRDLKNNTGFDESTEGNQN